MILSGEEILKYLPHRDPFLFIDEVVSLKMEIIFMLLCM